jgi:transcription antitermination factor NusG
MAVARLLVEREYEPFVPLQPAQPRSRRGGEPTPLFPGYIFCRIDLSNRTVPVVSTPGVIRLIGVGPTPIPIPEEEMDSLKRILASGLPSESVYLEIGQRVRITRGPLAGTEGVLCRMRDKHRLMVAVTLLNRAVSVEIDASWTMPVNSTSTVH